MIDCRFLIVTAIFLVSMGILSAQSQTLDSYGLKAGFTSAHASLKYESFEDQIERRGGFAAMAYAEWLLLPPLSIISESGFTQRGYSITFEVRNAEGEVLSTKDLGPRLNYLTAAFLVKLRASGALLEPYALGGPRTDILVGGSSDPNEGVTFDQHDTFTAGGTIGIGVEAGGERMSIPAFLEVRYNFDVMDSLSCCESETFNQALDVLIGVQI